MGFPPLPGCDAAGRVTARGGPRGCRKVRKNLDGTRLRDGARRDADRPAPARDQSVREVGELRNPERIRVDPDLGSSLTEPVPYGLCRLAGGASLRRHYLLLTLASRSARTRIMSPSPPLPTSPIVANASCCTVSVEASVLSNHSLD